MSNLSISYRESADESIVLGDRARRGPTAALRRHRSPDGPTPHRPPLGPTMPSAGGTVGTKPRRPTVGKNLDPPPSFSPLCPVVSGRRSPTRYNGVAYAFAASPGRSGRSAIGAILVVCRDASHHYRRGADRAGRRAERRGRRACRLRETAVRDRPASARIPVGPASGHRPAADRHQSSTHGRQLVRLCPPTCHH